MTHRRNNADAPGVLGDGALRAGRGNMALARRAIRERWPISAETRRKLVRQMLAIVERGKSERSQIGAAKVLVAADGVNVKREAVEAGANDPKAAVNVNVGVAVQAATADLRNDPEYLDYCRRRAVDADAGAVRSQGQPRALADGGDARPD